MALASCNNVPHQYMAVQRVFDTVDTLDRILDHFDRYQDRSSLARLARTRTTCFRPSISRLWQALYCFRPLLSLLPEHVLSDSFRDLHNTPTERSTTVILDEDLLRWNIYTPFVQGIFLMPCFLDETATAADVRGCIDIDKRNWHIMHLIVRINSTLRGVALPNLAGLGIGSFSPVVGAMTMNLKKPELTSVTIDISSMKEMDASLLGFLVILVVWKQITEMKVITQQLSDEARRAFWTVLNNGMEQLKSFSLCCAFGDSRFLLPVLSNLPHLNDLAIQDNWKLFPDPIHGDMVKTLWMADYVYAAEIGMELDSGAFHQLTDLNLISGARFCATLLHAVQGPLSRLTISTTFAFLDEFRTLVVSIVGSEDQPRRELKHVSLGFQNCWNCFVVDTCWAVLLRLHPLDLHSFDLEGRFYDDTTQDYRITEKGVAYLTSEWHNLRHLRMETFHMDALKTVRPMQKIIL